MAKSILITGCSSGIGLDCAETLRDAGWQVFASCRTQSDCDELAARGFDSPRLDHADRDSIVQTLAHITKTTGGTLDAVFNNGAFAIPGAVEDLPTDALRSIFETNLFGYHEVTRQVIPIMRAQGHGHILNCSSVLGFAAMRWRGAYNATKFAMEGLTDTLRLEMHGTGVHIVLINPGPITTKIRQNSIPHFEKWIDWENSARRSQYMALKDRLYIDSGKDRFELPPSAVTAQVIKALDSDRPKARYFVTTPTYLMAIFKRILPQRMFDSVTGRF
ncbi:MAG: SDR family NAD(P)-dependent oxidoreductase [Pseudomonadota bacterium]